MVAGDGLALQWRKLRLLGPGCRGKGGQEQTALWVWGLQLPSCCPALLVIPELPQILLMNNFLFKSTGAGSCHWQLRTPSDTHPERMAWLLSLHRAGTEKLEPYQICSHWSCLSSSCCPSFFFCSPNIFQRTLLFWDKILCLLSHCSFHPIRTSLFQFLWIACSV